MFRPQLEESVPRLKSTYSHSSGDIEATNPDFMKAMLRRNRSIVDNEDPAPFDNDHENALYKDFCSGYDEEDCSLEKEEDKTTTEENEVEEDKKEEVKHQKLANFEFLHLQEGVSGVFYQNEHFGRTNREAFEELAKKMEENKKGLDARLDAIEIAVRVLVASRNEVSKDQIAFEVDEVLKVFKAKGFFKK